MKTKLRVLYAPIHYVLDAHHSGSEFSWAYMIYKIMSSQQNVHSTFVAGGVRGINDKRIYNLEIFTPERIDTTTFTVMYFYIKLFVNIVRHQLVKKSDIIHHVLPFYIGHSFNIIPFITRKPFIIGPIQPGLSIQDVDANPADARGKSTSQITLSEKISKIILSFIKPLLHKLSLATLKKARILITVDAFTKELLIHKGIDSTKIQIVPPGICMDNFYKTRQDPFSKTLEIVTICYLVKRKRVDLILKALQRVLKKYPHIHFTIVGDGPQRGALEELARTLKIARSVTFVGHVTQDKIPEYYAQASVFVHMSQSEGFSVVSMEAMASGLCTISTRVGGFNTVITDSVNGYLIDIDDEIALSTKLYELCLNRDSVLHLGTQARKTVQHTYDWKNIIRHKYLPLYVKSITCSHA